MRSQHIWKEKDEDGRKREVRATKFGGNWKFQSKTADEERWTYHDVPLMEDLLKLQDIISRKYRRRRASAEDVESVDKLVRDRQTDSLIRLSLSQRERIKVRDCGFRAAREPTRLFPGRCPARRESDDSRNAGREFLCRPETFPVPDRMFLGRDSRDRHHPIRSLASMPDNKNPERRDELDVAGGICNDRSYDSGDAATRCVRIQSHSSVDDEPASLRDDLTSPPVSGKNNSIAPHLNPLPESGERRKKANICSRR
jgi:hypothetical protein